MRLRVLALLMCGSNLIAQPADTSAVPRDLVTAILSSYSGGMAVPSIVVGRVPQGFPAGLVPPGMTVLGGVLYNSGPAGRTPMVVLRAAEDPTALSDRLRDYFEGAGWDEFQYPGRGGFVGSSGERTMGMWCKDSLGVNVVATRPSEGPTFVQISYQPASRNSMCDARMRAEMAGRMGAMTATLPSLRPPSGVRLTGVGSSGGGDYRDSRAQAQTQMSASELLDHFLGQLEKEDWLVANKVGDPNLAAATLQKKDASGKTIFAAISAARQAGTIELSLRVTTPGARSGGMMSIP